MPVFITDPLTVKKIDTQSRNKFRFEWLEKTVSVDLISEAGVTTKLKECVKKVDLCGKCFCEWCSDFIDYSSRGWKALQSHMTRAKHRKQLEIRRSNYRIPFICKSQTINESGNDPGKTTTDPGNAENRTERKTKTAVSLCERVPNSEALILATLAEHSLPFKVAPVIVDLVKSLASDPQALSQLSMDRTSASIKMKYGMAETFSYSLVQDLKNYKFSLNIDEATSQNKLRVLTVLASYFCPVQNEVVIRHLTSLSVTTVNSQALFDKLVELFEDNQIPWSNLMSLLMDSCAVMRGSKSGLETRIRTEKASHLLDVDGDICHHLHNCTKKFCNSFSGWVEGLLRDLHTDFKWSADQCEVLSDICLTLGVKYSLPEQYVSHRWLSVYDVSLSTLLLFDALTVFYFGFLKNEDKVLYQRLTATIFKDRNTSLAARDQIRLSLSVLQRKTMTNDGEKRKERIIKKMFYMRSKTQMTLRTYVSVMPLLKKYVCLFETKEPLIHELHREMSQLFVDFLSCFMKAEELENISLSKLQSLDVTDSKKHLKQHLVFIGSGARSVIGNLHKKDGLIKEFYEQVMDAYIKCAVYMQKKLPLNNKLLRCLGAVGPSMQKHNSTLARLKKIPDFVTNVLSADELEAYGLEVHRYCVDSSLPTLENDKMRMDHWWASVFQTNKYPCISKVVQAVISCFHGPQVENSFSAMGDIITDKCGRMKVETQSAIQTARYELKAQRKTAVQLFHRTDKLYSEVHQQLNKNLRSSNRRYKENLKKKQELLAEKKAALSLETNKKIICKKAAKKLVQKSEKDALFRHQMKLNSATAATKILKRKYSESSVGENKRVKAN